LAVSTEGGMNMKQTLKKLMKEQGMMLMLTSAAILLHMIIGVMIWDRLPEQIATHFNMNSEPNGWSGKAFTVFGMPVILLLLHLVCTAAAGLPGFVMKNASPKIQRLVLFTVPAASLMMTIVIYGYALGAPFHIGRIVWIFVGIIFAVTGNYLPKTRRNPTIGIKLPWTLTDEENWNRTHRMAGPVWVICGLLLIICGWIGSGAAVAALAIAAAVAIPTAYSFVLHCRKRTKE